MIVEIDSEKSKCGYFEDLESESQYFLIYPDINRDNEKKEYTIFLDKGYRRSFNIVYKNVCPHCKKCTAIRLNPDEFIYSKSQRHCNRINSDIVVSIEQDNEKFITDEKIELYCNYFRKHNDNKSIDYETSKEYLSQMNYGYSGTWNMEYRLKDELVGVGIVDYTLNADSSYSSLSSNYFYYNYDKEIAKRSLGVFSILKEIELCKKLDFNWYYLGYYIADCNKMNYKKNYYPHELLIDGKWQKIEKRED